MIRRQGRKEELIVLRQSKGAQLGRRTFSWLGSQVGKMGPLLCPTDRLPELTGCALSFPPAPSRTLHGPTVCE